VKNSLCTLIGNPGNVDRALRVKDALSCFFHKLPQASVGSAD